MGVGEGGGELVKQLLNQTYDMKTPKVVAVLLKGKPCYGVGPHDVALTIIKAVYDNGFVKNKIMEFIGEGIAALPIEYRNSIDIMTTETTCWSSIWETDNEVKEYYKVHGRSDGYKQLKPAAATVYDGVVEVNLSDIKPSIALPFHPSNVFTIEDLNNNAEDIFRKVEKDSMEIFESNDVKIDLLGKIKLGKIHIDQGIIVGCSGGTFDNITAAADILRGKSTGNDSFSMSIYPESQPTYMELVKNGSVADLIGSGVLIKPAFCGPCFGAGDTPANNELSIRHATRNFPNRDGSKPTEGQSTMVALMDARSIAATAINGGILAGADEINAEYTNKKFFFNTSIYDKKVYNGWKKPQESLELVYGPNIKDWPKMPALTDDIIIKVVAYISDPVTTTDELIPSGETASYRSNPMRLAEFTLSRKDPSYVRKAKVVQEYELLRENGSNPAEKFKEIEKVYNIIKSIKGFEEINPSEIGIGSTIYANKPGDGSAREQAASCQRVLGAWANIAREYATKRYKSNLLNWGIIPFILENGQLISNEDYIFVPGIKNAISKGEDRIKGYVLKDDVYQIDLILEQLTDEEKEILISGSLINFKKLQKGDG
jgi:aconitate hydratase